MPIANHAARIAEQLAQLVACLNQAVELTEEIIDTSRILGLTVPQSSVRVVPGKPRANAAGISGQSPVADRATFSVRWHDNTCYLGNSLPFRLMERLAYCPNQLIHRDRLLDEVWECRRSREAMRSVVKVLRRKLCQAGMEDLAEAIDGTTAHHYGLMLNGRL
jgi:DNA-binding response OmpR family regulator